MALSEFVARSAANLDARHMLSGSGRLRDPRLA
jgi:hypothetical protein